MSYLPVMNNLGTMVLMDFIESNDDDVIKWRDEYCIGVGVIDDQHKHFIGILKKLYVALVADDEDSYPKILKDLKAYTDLHFKTEEKYFEKFNYSDAKKHKVAHNEIRKKVASFTDKDGNLLGDGFELLALLENWLVNHLETMDKKFASLFSRNGIK